MSTQNYIKFALVISCLVLGGCSILDSEDESEIDRTYPEALNLAQSTTQQVIDREVSRPDSVNINALVSIIRRGS